ncbi:MAG: T9SS type A sorting domain-containing protein [Candidatus Muiribacteriota bacterium]
MKKTIIFLILIYFISNICSLAPVRGDDSGIKNSPLYRHQSRIPVSSKIQGGPSLAPDSTYSPIREILPEWQGDIFLIVIPLEFSDKPFEDVSALYENIEEYIFNEENENSLAHFYKNASYGSVNIKGIYTEKVTGDPVSNYLGDSNYPKIARHALERAYALEGAYENAEIFQKLIDNPDGIYIEKLDENISIDKNGDGIISGVEFLPTAPDNVFLLTIHSGGAAELSEYDGEIPSHQWVIPDSWEGIGKEGKKIKFRNYSTFAELNIIENGEQSVPGGSNIAIACHEFAHQLGTSDIYNNSATESHGMGYWSLMGLGVYNDFTKEWPGTDFDIYHKYILGWADPVILNNLESGTNEITLSSTSDLFPDSEDKLGAIYFLNEEKTQYYLFGVRSGQFYDKHLFESDEFGLTILHVDETKKFSEPVYLEFDSSIRFDKEHPGVWMLRADNMANSKRDFNDLYPLENNEEIINNSFTPSSIPTSFGYNTFNAPVIKNIKRIEGNKISFDFINNKYFLISYAQNPLDKKKISLFARPNFEPVGDVKFRVFNSEQEEIITNTMNNIEDWIYNGGFRFEELTEGEYTIKVFDNEVETEALFSFEGTDNENTAAQFSVTDNYSSFDGVNLNSTSNIMVIDEVNNHSASDFNQQKAVSVFGNFTPEFDEDKGDIPLIYAKDFSGWGLLKLKDNYSDISKIGIFEDKTTPEIKNSSPLEFKISDKYSGIKEVSIIDISGKPYSFYNSASSYVLKNSPFESYIVEAVDYAGNRSALKVNKSSAQFIEDVKVYPNPASDFAVFEYKLDFASDVMLEIFDSSGSRVFKDKNMAGIEKFLWDLRDLRGNKVSNGTYFYKLKGEKAFKSGKISVLKENIY